MSKRKAKKYNKSKLNDNAIINNIDKLEVKTEIDYDKLAEAIVKAQEKAKEDEGKEITEILHLQKGGLSIIYFFISILGWESFFLLGFALVATIFWGNWSGATNIFMNIGIVLIVPMLMLVIFILSIKMKKLSDAVIKLKDKQLIVALTSSAVSFVALLISIVALIMSKI